MLLIPDAPNTATGDTTPVEETPFDELRDQIVGAIDGTAARVRAGYDALAAQTKDTTAALKSAPVKRAMEVDPTLKEQVDAAAAVFKQDTANAKTADQTLKALQKQAAAELSALQKLLG